MIHELQIASSAFKDVINNKCIKVRENKTFGEGDLLVLQTYEGQKPLGIEINKEIVYVVNLKHGYVELGIK